MMFAIMTSVGNKHGSALLLALVFLSILTVMTSAFVLNLNTTSKVESALEAQTKSFYIAEAGISHALWNLSKQGPAYVGESGVRFSGGTFSISINDDADDADKKIVVSRAVLDGYPEGPVHSEVRVLARVKQSQDEEYEITVERWEQVD